jgi:cobalamin biosynthesis protein CobD/CbiB
MAKNDFKVTASPVLAIDQQGDVTLDTHRTVVRLAVVRKTDAVSLDTVAALETLLEGARRGEITGIAYACTMTRQRYLTEIVGYCYENPTLARGAVASLSDELGRLVTSPRQCKWQR